MLVYAKVYNSQLELTPNKSRHIIPTHGTHNGVGTISFAELHAAKYIKLSPFSTSLEPSYSDTRSSLNFITVYSCSQNLPLIGAMPESFNED